MASKYTVKEVYAFAELFFEDGTPIVCQIANNTFGPFVDNAFENLDPDRVLETFIKIQLEGVGTYPFYGLIEVPYEDLPTCIGSMGPTGDKIIQWRLDDGK